MKFDLEKALAGEPIILKNGCKGFIKFQKPSCYNFSPSSALGGYWINDKNIAITENWRIDGVHYDDSNLDIVGMYEEPRPTVTLTLPCPLNEPQEGMWFIDDINSENPIGKSEYTRNNHVHWMNINHRFIYSGIYFSSKEDAQAWLDAMRNSRR